MQALLNKQFFMIASTVVLILGFGLGMYWSGEPDIFDVRPEVSNPPVGKTLTNTLIKVSETLLDKPGGFLANDVTPPSVFLDNMPSWEFGALEMT